MAFHDVIQAAFGWENGHLFEFKSNDGGIRISLPMDEGFFDPSFFAEAENASEVKLSDIFGDIRQLFYIYDFGDDWIHEITLEATAADGNAKTALCLSGKGACPPEDCGGIYGYEEIKNIFKSEPKSEQANEYREWLGLNVKEVWDAEAFDIDEVNAILKRIR
jgi:hypothetical protein